MYNPTDTATIKNDKLCVIQYYHYAKSPKYQTYKRFREWLFRFKLSRLKTIGADHSPVHPLR